MEELLRLINEESRNRGVAVELFLADLLAQRLDPKDRVDIYLKIHEELLRHSDDEYAKGDLVQASEKLWGGAVAALLNAIAELRGGWDHYSHRDYDVIINRLFKETNDKELPLYFGAAERLHANFYHNFMTRDEYEVHREYVLKLINKLRGLLKR